MKAKSILCATALMSALFAVPASAQNADAEIPTQQVNEKLQNMLPEEIKSAGSMISVNNGSFPPYEIAKSPTTLDGASADLAKAIGELLGVQIEHRTVSGLSALLSGIGSNRFQFAMGPVGDFESREKNNDFVDYVQEYVVFAVKKGNPLGITSLENACGARIAVMAGGSAERVIKAQAEKCTKDGKKPIDVQSYADQPTSILSVRSNRADAFFSSQAPLTYFVQQSNGELELAAVGKALLESIKVLKQNGTYEAIMKKWGLENNMISEPGINLATK
jgi:polar amino acid transport system substrate-binding protein